MDLYTLSHPAENFNIHQAASNQNSVYHHPHHHHTIPRSHATASSASLNHESHFLNNSSNKSPLAPTAQLSSLISSVPPSVNLPLNNSPSNSPRKRASTTGNRYSPPPALSHSSASSPAVPNIPLTPPTPMGPSRPAPSPPKKLSAPSPELLRPSSAVDQSKQSRFLEMQQRAMTTPLYSNNGTRPSTARPSTSDPKNAGFHDTTKTPKEIQKEKDKQRKQMLSKALQMAHQAVLLDNAHNFEGAIDAYSEACDLLHQVLLRSTADEERRKLDHIRETYSSRVQELLHLHPRISTDQGLTLSAKPLPAQPISSPEISQPSQQQHILNVVKPEPTIKSSLTISQTPHSNTLGISSNFLSPMDPNYAPPPLSPRKNTFPSEYKSSSPPKIEDPVQPKAVSTTQAEFDAALDAAIEAAYDDGYEPVDNPTISKPVSATAQPNLPIEDLYDESGMLNEPQELDRFDFGLHSKNAPRQSDSSGYSGSTWHGSVSSRATGSSSLTTVSESNDNNYLAATNKALGSLPRLSEEHNRPNENGDSSRPVSIGRESVRDRRLSGQNARQLKIETQPPLKIAPVYTKDPIQEEPASGSRSAGATSASENIHKPFSIIPQLPPIPTSAGSRPLLSPNSNMTISPATPGLPFLDDSLHSPGGNKLPRPTYLRKNKSSMSLKQRTLSISSPDGSDGSLATPMSTYSFGRRVTNPSSQMNLSTTTSNVLSTHAEFHQGAVQLFKTDFHSPHTPGLPNSQTASDDGPTSLEKCPEPTLLRPFWLLRCIYQTIANPAGGYISTRLYVTPAVWNTRGVKLKHVEDKIVACDSLSAALGRLAKVDEYDAAAVLDEMQTFESVLDSVQTMLHKRLGNDVGVQGTGTFIKDAVMTEGSATAGSQASSESNSHTSLPSSRSSSKSYLSSWRKLRSSRKTDTTPLPVTKDIKKTNDAANAPKMASVPMTKDVSVLERGARGKRDLSVLTQITGQNAAYMIAIAKLCDAAQIVDLIARQVEDPGLRGSSQTHVGLELSTRHASEFFAFFMCRWIIGDLSILLDKFVKRSTEWVMT